MGAHSAADQAGKYKAYADGQGGYLSSNPAQGFQIAYQRDGTTRLSPRDGDAETMPLGLRLTGIGYDNLAAFSTPKSVAAQASKVTYNWSDTVSEWWENDAKPVGAMFRIEERLAPNPHQHPLRLRMALETDLAHAQSGHAIRFQQGNTTITYDHLKVWDASGQELRAQFALRKSQRQ